MQFDSEILVAGGQALVVNNNEVSLDDRACLRVGAMRRHCMGRSSTSITIDIGGEHVAMSMKRGNDNGLLVIGTATLSPGHPATAMKGQAISFGANGMVYWRMKPVATPPIPATRSGA